MPRRLGPPTGSMSMSARSSCSMRRTKPTGRAATTTTIRRSCRPVFDRPTTRCWRRAPRLTRHRSICAARKPPIIRERHPLREARDDQARRTLYAVAAVLPLADGGNGSGDAVHRYRHGLDAAAALPGADRDPQAARDRHPDPRIAAPRRAILSRRAAAPGGSALVADGRRQGIPCPALHAADRDAAGGLVDAVGRRLPDHALRADLPAADHAA